MAALPSNGLRAAAVDIGTNSVLLSIAEPKEDGHHVLLERATVTRLGEGVDRSNSLSPIAIERTLSCLRDYAVDIARMGVTRLGVVGTSALRDAVNAEAFLEPAEALLGTRPRVIDGLEEARLTCIGALSGLGLEGPFVVFDVGGGSTEVIQGRASSWAVEPVRFISLNIGCVRLSERYIHSDPPTPAELEAVTQDARTAIATIPFKASSGSLIGVAGTVTTMAAMHHGLLQYDPVRVHGTSLEQNEITERIERLAALNRAERSRVPGMTPARSDVILSGMIIVRELVSALGHKVLVVSDRGVRYGLLHDLLR